MTHMTVSRRGVQAHAVAGIVQTRQRHWRDPAVDAQLFQQAFQLPCGLVIHQFGEQPALAGEQLLHLRRRNAETAAQGRTHPLRMTTVRHAVHDNLEFG